MRAHYDLSGGGKPNPYYKRISPAGRKVLIEQFLQSENLVRLDDDLAKAFPDEATVNETLRLALRMKGVLSAPTRPSPRRPRTKKSA
jgi:hypothetical protein